MDDVALEGRPFSSPSRGLPVTFGVMSRDWSVSSMTGEPFVNGGRNDSAGASVVMHQKDGCSGITTNQGHVRVQSPTTNIESISSDNVEDDTREVVEA